MSFAQKSIYNVTAQVNRITLLIINKTGRKYYFTLEWDLRNGMCNTTNRTLFYSYFAYSNFHQHFLAYNTLMQFKNKMSKIAHEIPKSNGHYM